MAEFTFNPLLRVEPGQNIILNDAIPCNRGYVLHRNESGIVILRGITSGCACFARYQVTFNGNIAIPEDQPLGPISISLALDGEPIQTSRAIFTPAEVVEDPVTPANFGNVTSTAIITVPKGCCFTVAVENTSGGVDGAPAPAILVQNANMTVARIA